MIELEKMFAIIAICQVDDRIDRISTKNRNLCNLPVWEGVGRVVGGWGGAAVCGEDRIAAHRQAGGVGHSGSVSFGKCYLFSQQCGR